MTCYVACSPRPAQCMGISMQSSSFEREEMEGMMELRRKVEAVFSVLLFSALLKLIGV